MKMMKKQMSEFFSKSPQEQTAEIDKRLRDQERFFKDMQARQAQNGGNANAGRGGFGGFGGQFANMSQEERQKQGAKMMREFLDMTTPEFRAQMSQFRQMTTNSAGYDRSCGFS